MNRLDEIAARAELAQGAWEGFQLGIATTRFALDEANNSAEDVKPLVAALKAVEAVCAGMWSESIQDNTIIRDAGIMQDAVMQVRAAIREALGS